MELYYRAVQFYLDEQPGAPYKTGASPKSEEAQKNLNAIWSPSRARGDNLNSDLDPS